MANNKTVFVAGGTGATGRFVVQQLLDKGHSVRVVVRSKDRMMELLSGHDTARLSVTEALLLDLPIDQLQPLTKDCDAVVVCLGHHMTVSGMYGHPRQLVTDSVKHLTTAMKVNDTVIKNNKFILMCSNGVENPSGVDRQRSTLEGVLFTLLRYLVPPHKDNEMAAAYLYDNLKPVAENGSDKTTTNVEWVVVRPSDLIDTAVTDYVLHKQSPKGPFRDEPVARANVADFMVNLILNDAQ